MEHCFKVALPGADLYPLQGRNIALSRFVR